MKLCRFGNHRSLSASPAHAHDMLKFSWNATDHVKALAPCRFLHAPKPGFLPSGRRAAAATIISCYPASKAPTLAVVSEGSAQVEPGLGSLANRFRLGSLTEDGLSYKERFIVRCYEEVVCNHIQSFGFSTDGFATSSTMRKMNVVWVTARMHIEIYKYPAWNDVVEIEMWFHKEGWIGTRQDWILKDYANGQVIGRATRLAFPEENNGSLKKIDKLEYPTQYSRLGLVPRRADLDMNQHVNNVTYIGWVLESIPQEIINSYELQTITLDYRREHQHDNVIDSLSSHEPDENLEAISQLNGTKGSAASPATVDYRQFLHLLRLSGDGLEINRGRTQWRKKPMR